MNPGLILIAVSFATIGIIVGWIISADKSDKSPCQCEVCSIAALGTPEGDAAFLAAVRERQFDIHAEETMRMLGERGQK